MTKRILVAYATRTGWTVGVAEAIGQVLSEGGAQVDVRAIQDVDDLTAYQAVVAGSAIQAGQWLPEAMQFIRGHQAELCRIPFAAFLVCMTLAMPGNKYQDLVAAWLQPVRELVRPVSEGLFAGGLDIRRVPSLGNRLKFRLSVLFGAWSEGDHRDWAAIRAWAQSTRPLLSHPKTV